MLGKVINQGSHDRICDLLDPADHKGKVVLGNVNAHKDRILTPTIIVNPARDCGLMKAEIFGPIMPVLTFKKIDEVIAFINSKPKPLAIYYYGSNSSSNANLIKIKD